MSSNPTRNNSEPKRDLASMLDVLAAHQSNPVPPCMDPKIIRGGRNEGELEINPRYLKRSVAVFQPRKVVGTEPEVHLVVKELKEAISRGEKLDPVVIWWSGKEWFLVDGHHRTYAYEQINKKWKEKETKSAKGTHYKPLWIPAKITEGNLSEARLWSTKENGKAHLRMQRADKMNFAWNSICLNMGGFLGEKKFVVSQAALELHVSRRILTTMKQAWTEISLPWAELDEADRKGRTLEKAEEDWSKVRREWKDEDTEWEPEDFDVAVTAMRDRLISSIGKEVFHEKPEVIAAAIMQISRQFPERALQVDEWMDVTVQAVVASHDVESELKEMLRTYSDSGDY